MADGGSSEWIGSSLMKRITFQSTAAHMFRPMISNAMTPLRIDRMPMMPMWVGPSWLSPRRPSHIEWRGVMTRAPSPRGTGGPASNGAASSMLVNSV